MKTNKQAEKNKHLKETYLNRWKKKLDGINQRIFEIVYKCSFVHINIIWMYQCFMNGIINKLNWIKPFLIVLCRVYAIKWIYWAKHEITCTTHNYLHFQPNWMATHDTHTQTHTEEKKINKIVIFKVQQQYKKKKHT